ncbi:MAG: hypothetical protein IT427_04600 [Pirellulales bacterium]|nr:hypothetical protein [Pirellulales bacterium]
MKIFIGIMVAILAMLVPLLCVGAVVGGLLKWLFGMEWGSAVLTGVVSTGFATHLVLYVLASAKSIQLEKEVQLDDEGDDESANEFLSRVKIDPPAFRPRGRKARR